MTNFYFYLTDSLYKVMPVKEPGFTELEKIIGFSGEKVSFQLAYSCDSDEYDGKRRSFLVSVNIQPRTVKQNKVESVSILMEQNKSEPVPILMEKVELVPSRYPCHGIYDDNYITTEPGMFPDLLIPIKEGESVTAFPNQYRALRFTIEFPQLNASGWWDIEVQITSPYMEETRVLHTECYVCKARLPKQRLYHTEWFHTDCLADFYQIPVWSEAHWKIIDNFMKSAADHGINMLLTPLFTPPLDTEKGGERTTVQLLEVYKIEEERYQFDFSRLERWITLCEKNNISNLEFSHFFTQWGAESAPKIMCEDTARTAYQLFGWNTAADSKEYRRFLGQLIPALKEELVRLGWYTHSWFHVSDEPNEEQIESFGIAADIIKELLPDCKRMDALSSYAIYKKGYVDIPVVSLDNVQKFIEKKVPHLWGYHCTGQAVDVPNRFMAMPNARNRILGVLLYYYDMEGFLQWGFNFYNSRNSKELINPYFNTDASEAFPSGDTFLVYPAPDGSAYDSVRGATLSEAMEDYRILQCLEEEIGKDAVKEMLGRLCDGTLTFQSYPREPDFFTKMRKQVVKYLDGGSNFE